MVDAISAIISIVFFIAGGLLSYYFFSARSIVKMESDIKDIKTELQRLIALAGNNTLISSFYLMTLSAQFNFLEKLFVQRQDKFLICNEIVLNHLSLNDKIIIDSGTTVDQIPQLLNESYMRYRANVGQNPNPPPEISTNNLLAAVSVIPPEINVNLMEGIVDKKYVATYHPRNIILPIDNFDATKIVLAATTISYIDGPMVSVSDSNNKKFKAALIDKALGPKKCNLIIAIDWTKFNSKTPLMNPVVTHDVWQSVLAEPRFCLVTTKPDRANHPAEADIASNIIAKFENNAKNGGMRVVISNQHQ
jgi:hypothetical protein